jgi:hypothetical protein
VEALSAIFPDEFTLLSAKMDNGSYLHPISYRIDLPKTSGDGEWWPPRPIALGVQYPHDYPATSTATITLIHENNVMEFSSAQTQALQRKIREAAEQELGMPSVLSCVYAAREFFESGESLTVVNDSQVDASEANVDNEREEVKDDDNKTSFAPIQRSSAARIQECNLQGLEIAQSLLSIMSSDSSQSSSVYDSNVNSAMVSRKGGSWEMVIG